MTVQDSIIEQELADLASLVDDLAVRLAEDQPAAAGPVAAMMQRASRRFEVIARQAVVEDGHGG